MAIFNNMRITDKGKILYAKAQAGHELHFTKMKVGAGNVDSRNPDTLLDLISPKYDVGIQSISPNQETKSAVISGMINNGAVTEPTYICEIGLFAEDPDEGEILYGYASAGQYGDYYAPSSVGPFTWNYQVVAAIGNAANVTVELSNLVYDYGVINTNTTFIHLSGGNQKEINKSIDNMFKKVLDGNDHIYYCEASGTVNTYRVTIDEYTKKAYTKGIGIAVLINANSTGASTININGIGAVGIKKANGNDVTNLKANSIYTMRYNGTNFILQGEGASGNAKSSDLLSGKIAESDNGELLGTIPIKGAQTYIPSTVDQVINAKQYLDGDQIIKGEPNLIPENLVEGLSYFGMQGSAKKGGFDIIENVQINNKESMSWNFEHKVNLVLVVGYRLTQNSSTGSQIMTHMVGYMTSSKAFYTFGINTTMTDWENTNSFVGTIDGKNLTITCNGTGGSSISTKYFNFTLYVA